MIILEQIIGWTIAAALTVTAVALSAIVILFVVSVVSKIILQIKGE
mgnify:CR=1 FL=1